MSARPAAKSPDSWCSLELVTRAQTPKSDFAETLDERPQPLDAARVDQMLERRAHLVGVVCRQPARERRRKGAHGEQFGAGGGEILGGGRPGHPNAISSASSDRAGWKYGSSRSRVAQRSRKKACSPA